MVMLVASLGVPMLAFLFGGRFFDATQDRSERADPRAIYRPFQTSPCQP